MPAAARTLARAFHDYPWTRWAVPADGYARRLEELQDLYLRHALEHGLVMVTEEADAVLALLPPTTPDPAPTVQSRIAELHGDRLHQVAQVTLPSGPADAWRVATLGVQPARAGRGLGSATLVAGLAALDEVAGPVPVALETSEERNVRLYERHGFDVAARTQPEDGPTVWSMVRDARR